MVTTGLTVCQRGGVAACSVHNNYESYIAGTQQPMYLIFQRQHDGFFGKARVQI